MKKFNEFTNENLGFELHKPDHQTVMIGDVKCILDVSKDGNNEFIIKLLPTIDEYKHMIWEWDGPSNDNIKKYLNYWNRKGFQALNEQKGDIPIKIEPATSHKTFNAWIETDDIDINMLAKMYLNDKYNI